MARVFLSPSTQEFNQYLTGGNEQLYMNLLADRIEQILNQNGIETGRNNPDGSFRDSINQSNADNYDLHVALHSNASPEIYPGLLRGPDIYYYQSSQRGLQAAEIISDNLKNIYPEPELVNTLPSTSLAELRRTRAPSVFIEVAYHDNPEDEQFIKNNLDEIAQNISLSIIQYLNEQGVS